MGIPRNSWTTMPKSIRFFSFKLKMTVCMEQLENGMTFLDGPQHRPSWTAAQPNSSHTRMAVTNQFNSLVSSMRSKDLLPILWTTLHLQTHVAYSVEAVLHLVQSRWFPVRHVLPMMTALNQL